MRNINSLKTVVVKMVNLLWKSPIVLIVLKVRKVPEKKNRGELIGN